MKTFIFTLLVLLTYPIYSQQDPQFSIFKGTVHAIPREELLQPFSEKMLEYRKIEEIAWKDINFEPRLVYQGYPDIWTEEPSFAIYLESTMTILEDACYEFHLETDDGSILWIDNKQIIDNSGNHPMTLKSGSDFYKAGEYPVKIWYYQGWPDQCGFIFRSENMKSRTKCLEEKVEETSFEKFSLNGAVLFDFGSFQLKPSAKDELDQIISVIESRDITTIIIEGHSDSQGDKEVNLKLSNQRALSVKQYFLNFIKMSEITIEAIGKGEDFPIADNETEEGRAENRRVVILVN